MFKHHLILGIVREKHFTQGRGASSWQLDTLLCWLREDAGLAALAEHHFAMMGGRISLRMRPRSSEERPREIKQGKELWVEFGPQIHAHLEPPNVGFLQV